jgi:hypothetical protein
MHGTWTEIDKLGTTVIFEWERFDGTTKQYIELLKKQARDRAITLAKHMEIVARVFINHPEQLELVQDVAEKKSFIEMRDCIVAEKSMAEWLEHAFLSICDKLESELASKGPGDTIIFIIVAKELDGTILGFVEFNINPEYPAGDVQLEPLGVLPYAQGRGLSRFLAFSILRLWPVTKRIFLGTMQDNKDVYTHLGFTVYEDAGGLGLNFEYKVNSLNFFDTTK